MDIKAIYDNGGKTVDRYTIFFKQREAQKNYNGAMHECLGLSDNPSHPQGFSQWGEGSPGTHCGKKIEFSDLPLNVQDHAKSRIGF